MLIWQENVNAVNINTRYNVFFYNKINSKAY